MLNENIKLEQSDSNKGPHKMPCSVKGISVLGTILSIINLTNSYSFRYEQKFMKVAHIWNLEEIR